MTDNSHNTVARAATAGGASPAGWVPFPTSNASSIAGLDLLPPLAYSWWASAGGILLFLALALSVVAAASLGLAIAEVQELRALAARDDAKAVPPGVELAAAVAVPSASMAAAAAAAVLAVSDSSAKGTPP